MTAEHLPEPPIDPYEGIEWTLYLKGVETPWPLPADLGTPPLP